MTPSAREASKHLADLLRREQSDMADFLVALAAFDAKRLWVDLGYASLFWFLHRELGLSRGAAYHRKVAAELIQRHPEVVPPLRDGRLCLTSVAELATVLTPENRGEVLPRFFHLSRLDAKAVRAELAPDRAPRFRTVVTVPRPSAKAGVAPMPVPSTGPVVTTRAAPTSTSPAPSTPTAATPVAPPPTAEGAPAAAIPGSVLPQSLGSPVNPVHANSPAAPQESPRAQIEPLTAELRRFHVTVSRRFLEKLAAARDALSHAMPRANEEDILEAGLDLVLARHATRKGLVARPLAAPRPSGPDHIPAHVSREVWERDEGKCQWPLASGGICGSTRRVERDHRRPRAKGGPATAQNIGLYCDFHNDLAAREAFGDALMDLFTRDPRKPGGAREPVARYGAA